MVGHLFKRPPPPISPQTDVLVRTPKRQNPFVPVVAVLMVLLAVGCLYLSVSAIKEKTRLAHALRQIGAITMTTKQMATTDHRILDGNGDDLLATLDKLGQLKTTGDVAGHKSITNPWGGTVTASTFPGAQVRIETIVPQRVCRRIVSVFGSNATTSNIVRIELKNEQRGWTTIFTKNPHDTTNVLESDLVAGCNDAAESDVALIFDLS